MVHGSCFLNIILKAVPKINSPVQKGSLSGGDSVERDLQRILVSSESAVYRGTFRKFVT